MNDRMWHFHNAWPVMFHQTDRRALEPLSAFNAAVVMADGLQLYTRMINVWHAAISVVHFAQPYANLTNKHVWSYVVSNEREPSVLSLDGIKSSTTLKNSFNNKRALRMVSVCSEGPGWRKGVKNKKTIPMLRGNKIPPVLSSSWAPSLTSLSASTRVFNPTRRQSILRIPPYRLTGSRDGRHGRRLS